MRPLRRLLLAGVLLTSGTIINLCVSWGCLLVPRRSALGPGPEPSPWPPLWAPVEWTEFQGEIAYVCRANGGFGIRTLYCYVMEPAGLHRPPSGIERLSRVIPGVLEFTDAGWPAFSFRVERGTAGSKPIGPPGLRRGLEVSGARTHLPLLPLWPGFAINTLAYAGVLAAPLVAMALRRRTRLRRGLCPRCAYDLKGLNSAPCPECGHNSPSQGSLPHPR